MRVLNFAFSINIARVVLLIIVFSNSLHPAIAQEKTPDNIAERLFMPALQMGIIDHNSDNISSGMMIQTSLDYRTKKGLLLRINYDDFSGRLHLKFPNNQTYRSRIPLSEFIGGIGYRLTKNRSNFFLIVQSGIRLYEQPIIQNTDGNFSIEQKAQTIGTMRYTLGFEYEIFESVFFNTELFIGHFYNDQDFWSNQKPYYGITAGVSARLF